MVNRLSFEQLYPYVFAAITSIVLYALDSRTPTLIANAGFSLADFFTFVQNLELFGAGIIFSVFVFAMAPAAGFIGRIQSTKTFALFRRYTIEAMIVGVLAAVVVIPLANAQDEQIFASDWARAVCVTALTGLTLFTLLVLRVVMILFYWSKHQK